jgi:hypothetical protein
MINKETLPYLGSGVNLYAGNKATQVRNQPGQNGDVPVTKGMSQAVELAGVKAGIGEQDFQGIYSRRVILKDGFDIIFYAPDKRH